MSEELARIRDGQPYIGEVKDVILARSGIYKYRRDEVLARGFKPKVDKEWYLEFRPAAVIVAAKDLFNLVPVPNKEHTAENITASNFHELASGIVGGPIDVVPMPNGTDIALRGKIAFFTHDAHDYYMAGNKETSADYVSKTELVDNPEEVGYDILMTKIISVNNVAITSQGRGGHDVRVQDSLPENTIDRITGRKSMGILSAMFGFDKPKDSFSAQVRDSLVRAKTADTIGVAKEAEGIMALVQPFADSATKSVLIGAVRDSFNHPEKVLEAWKETAPLMDGLYARCLDSETALAAEVKDSFDKKSGKKDSEKDDEKPGKKDSEKDDEKEEGKKEDESGKKDSVTSEVQDSLVDLGKKIDELAAKIPGIVDERIKAMIDGGSRQQDSLPVDSDGDVSFIFGSEARH